MIKFPRCLRLKRQNSLLSGKVDERMATRIQCMKWKPSYLLNDLSYICKIIASEFSYNPWEGTKDHVCNDG